MLVTSIWCIVSRTGQSVTMNGAFAGSGHSQLLPVVSAAAKVIVSKAMSTPQLPTRSCMMITPSRSSPFCLPTTRYPILAMLLITVNRTFHFDGHKCFFEVAAISEEELWSLPHVFLTSQENTPYEPSVRMNTVRAIMKNSHHHEAPWKHHLGFIPDLVVQKSLKATTQFVPMVEAKSREHMRDHLLTRLLELKHWRINDTACCDTFFSSIDRIPTKKSLV